MRDAVRYTAIGAGVLMAVGSLLPWVKVGIFSAAGTEGDGVFTLGIGVIVAFIGAANKPTRAAALGVMALSVVAGLIVFNIFGDIDSSAVGSGLLLTGAAAVVAFFTGFEIRNDAKAGLEAAYLTPSATPPPPPTPPSSPDAASRLQKLTELHSSGALTDAEYESKRQQILDEL